MDDQPTTPAEPVVPPTTDPAPMPGSDPAPTPTPDAAPEEGAAPVDGGTDSAI